MQKRQEAQATIIEQENTASVYEALCQKINLNAVDSVIDIEQFQSAEKMSEASADERIAAAVSVFLKMIQDSSQKVERLDKSLLDYHIARIDEQLSRQLDEILHNEEFQKIESAWRGLKFLVDRTDFRHNVKIEILDVSKEDLIQDFEDAPEIVQSGLYRHTYSNEYDTPGGEPIGAVISNYEFDRSLWGDVKNPDDFASDSAESFMTPPDPNMLAYKTVELLAEKEEDGSLVIRTNPPLPNLNIQNKLTLENKEGKCGVLKNHMKTSYKNNTLTVSGKLPESCLGQELYLNMYSMKEYVGKSFVNQWRQQDGTVSDGLTIGVAPHDAHVLASHLSKPLTDILTDMNKHSNNLIARSVFLKFAGNMSDYKLAQAKAASIVKSELAVAGINTEGLVLENGSGLSRVERLNARMMAQMLEKAYFSPFKNEFISTLPIAGKDGTLKTRLKQPGENLRLKTGTLKDVRALAGYWLGEKPLLVVVIINSQKSTDYLRDLDKLVSKIVQPGGEHWIDAKASCMIRYQA